MMPTLFDPDAYLLDDKPILIHIGDEPTYNEFYDVESYNIGWRPWGGLWTSPKQDNHTGCSWADYMERMDYTHHYTDMREDIAWRVDVKPDALWLRIDENSIDYVIEEFLDDGMEMLDWAKIAAYYDVAYVPDWEFHALFEMFDCNTAIILNWDAINSVEKDEEVTYKVRNLLEKITEGDDDGDLD